MGPHSCCLFLLSCPSPFLPPSKLSTPANPCLVFDRSVCGIRGRVCCRVVHWLQKHKRCFSCSVLPRSLIQTCVNKKKKKRIENAQLLKKKKKKKKSPPLKKKKKKKKK